MILKCCTFKSEKTDVSYINKRKNLDEVRQFLKKFASKKCCLCSVFLKFKIIIVKFLKILSFLFLFNNNSCFLRFKSDVAINLGTIIVNS